MKKTLAILFLTTLVAACSNDNRRYIGDVSNPLCAKDGSVVFYQNKSNKGRFVDPESSRKNCSWNK